LIPTITSAILKIFNFLLDINYYVTYPYAPSRFDEELKGMADGSNNLFTYQELRRINFIPELLKAHCSMVGAWGNATKDGNVIQLRALDWAFSANISKNPSINIYHPEKG
jgi:hypothetical protein